MVLLLLKGCWGFSHRGHPPSLAPALPRLFCCRSCCAQLLCVFTLKTPGTKWAFQCGNLKELAVTLALHEWKTYLQLQGLMELIILYEPAVSWRVRLLDMSSVVKVLLKSASWLLATPLSQCCSFSCHHLWDCLKIISKQFLCSWGAEILFWNISLAVAVTSNSTVPCLSPLVVIEQPHAGSWSKPLF